MSADMKPCKICGTKFVPCLTQLPSGFNWRTVTCSPECGQKYLTEILISRGLMEKEQPVSVPAEEEAPLEVENEQPEEEEAKEPTRKKKK